MKKILITFIGNTDPYGAEGTKGAILVLQKEFSFDEIFVLPTQTQNIQDNADLLKDAFEEEKIGIPNIKIIQTTIQNPVSYPEIFPKATNIFEKIIEQNKDNEIFFNASSGTPQLKLFGQLFADQSDVPIQILVVNDPRKLQEGQNHIDELDLSFLESHFLKKSIGKLLENSEFLRIAESFEKLAQKTLLPEKKEKFQQFSKLFRAYHFWDLFQFQEAETIWKKNSNTFLTKILEISNQKEILGKLINSHQSETKESMWELFYNMERREKQGNYIDVVSRFWRIWEGVLDIEIEKRKEDWGKYQKENLKEKQNPSMGDKVKYLNDCKIQLFDKIKSKRWRNELLDAPKKDKNSKLLKDKRNSSIAAHGMRGIAQEDAKKSLKIAESLLKEIFGKVENVLDAEKLKKIVDSIEK